MIPLRDTVQSKIFPAVNTLLISLNILVFLLEMGHGSDLGRIFYQYGIVPARYSVPELAARFGLLSQLTPFISSMFLHGGFMHIIGNMWFLYIFGDNVEDHLGPLRYLLFYLLCGLFAGLTHLMLNWNSQVPTVGASGAIAGVMGAYFILHPRARVLTLIPIFLFFPLVEVPAYIFLGIWFLIQFLSGAGGGENGVAWWAHSGGFLFGILFLLLFRALPRMGTQARLEKSLRRRHTPRLTRIATNDYGPGLDTRSTMTVTGREARLGTKKTLIVPHGFRQRTIRVTVPPGTDDNAVLRLKGLGQPSPGEPGDLYLRISIRRLE